MENIIIYCSFFVIIIDSNLVGSLAVFVFNFKFNLINHYLY